MKTVIHINQAIINRNKKFKSKEPAITVKTYKSNRYGTRVKITGPAEVIYCPDNPLPCGAVAWVETNGEVEVFENYAFEMHVNSQFYVETNLYLRYPRPFRRLF
jgi:hypothetical protein